MIVSLLFIAIEEIVRFFLSERRFGLVSMGEEGECSRRRPGELEVNLILKKKEERRLNGSTLVGKIMAEKNLNTATTIQMIRKGWNLQSRDDLEIVQIDRKAFIFEFLQREDYVRILRGRPWSINGLLLNIQRWEEEMTFSEVDFNFCPFWIQFHDLPLGAMDVDNAMWLGGLIGDVVMVEDLRAEGLLSRSFLRARILVDLRKPLVTGMWPPRENKDPLWIKARYESLQSFCFACGRIGHDLRGCTHKEGGHEEVVAEYGNWFSVQASRWMEGMVIICKEGREKAEGWKAKVKQQNIALSPVVKEQRAEKKVSKEVEEISYKDRMKNGVNSGEEKVEVEKKVSNDVLL